MDDTNPYAVTATAASLNEEIIDTDALLIESEITADFLLSRMEAFQQASRQAMLAYRKKRLHVLWRLAITAIMLGVVSFTCMLLVAQALLAASVFGLANGLALWFYLSPLFHLPKRAAKRATKRIHHFASHTPFAFQAILRPKGLTLNDCSTHPAKIRWSQIALAFVSDDFVIFVGTDTKTEFLFVDSPSDLAAVVDYLQKTNVQVCEA